MELPDFPLLFSQKLHTFKVKIGMYQKFISDGPRTKKKQIEKLYSYCYYYYDNDDTCQKIYDDDTYKKVYDDAAFVSCFWGRGFCFKLHNKTIFKT